jgi:hypothetical protein
MTDLTDEQRRFYTQELTKHYGEPVMPVSRYCDKISQYIKALSQCETGGALSQQQLEELKPHLLGFHLMTAKSNLLHRLLYLDEDLRTKKCPEHNGVWSGCDWPPCPHGCSSGNNITGWIKE